MTLIWEEWVKYGPYCMGKPFHNTNVWTLIRILWQSKSLLITIYYLDIPKLFDNDFLNQGLNIMSGKPGPVYRGTAWCGHPWSWTKATIPSPDRNRRLGAKVNMIKGHKDYEMTGFLQFGHKQGLRYLRKIYLVNGFRLSCTIASYWDLSYSDLGFHQKVADN